MRNDRTASKLALILSVLGFLNVTLLSFMGLFVGTFLATAGLHVARHVKSKKEVPTDFIAISMFFIVATYLFVVGLAVMFTFMKYF